MSLSLECVTVPMSACQFLPWVTFSRRVLTRQSRGSPKYRVWGNQNSETLEQAFTL